MIGPLWEESTGAHAHMITIEQISRVQTRIDMIYIGEFLKNYS